METGPWPLVGSARRRYGRPGMWPLYVDIAFPQELGLYKYIQETGSLLVAGMFKME